MERTKVIFCSSDNSSSTELQLYCNDRNEIFIDISEPGEQMYSTFITLNKETAIKLSKHLRKEISYLLQTENQNGI